jgi:hypothetical protein
MSLGILQLNSGAPVQAADALPIGRATGTAETDYSVSADDVLRLGNGTCVSQSLAKFIRNVDLDITPSLFFDPTITTGPGGASLGRRANNPFTTVAQLNNWLAANAYGAGQRIGFKRGVIYGGAVNLAPVTGSDDAQCIIGPYGDSLALPQVVGGVVYTGWQAVAGYPGMYAGVLPVTDTSVGYESEIYESGVRLIRVPQVADPTPATVQAALALAAAHQGTPAPSYTPDSLYVSGIAGYCAFDNLANVHYIMPLSANPNLGQIEVATEDMAFSISIPTQANNGNLLVMGIHARLARNIAFAINPLAGGVGTSGNNIVVESCIAGQSGVDSTNAQGANSSMAAFSFSGNYADDSYRCRNFVHRGNFSYQAMNNAVEFAVVDGAIVESNESHEINGCCIVENFASCSNVVARYNRGYGDLWAWFRAINGGGSANSYQKAGFWQSALYVAGGATQMDTGGTKNSNNTYAFNLVEDVPLQFAHVIGGSCKIHHNTFVRRVANSNQTFYEAIGSVSGAANSAEFTNNLCVDMGADQSGQNLYTMSFVQLDGTSATSGVAQGLVPAGDRNCYATAYQGTWMISTGFTCGFLFDGMNGASASADAWRQKVAPYNLDQNSYANRQYFGTNPNGQIAHSQGVVDSKGRPLAGSIVYGNGASASPSATFSRDPRIDYSRDIEGKPMSLGAPNIGCYGGVY